MSKECKCIKSYKVTAQKYLGNKQHSEPFLLEIFKEGSDYYYHKIKSDYWVAPLQKHLRHKSMYSTHVEDLTEDEFFEHFLKKY
jgi:hypothetical protein